MPDHAVDRGCAARPGRSARWHHGAGFWRNASGELAGQVCNNDAYAWTNHYAINRAYTANGLNQYSAAGEATFGYDLNGNLILDGKRTYVCDIENRLVAGSTGAAT